MDIEDQMPSFCPDCGSKLGKREIEDRSRAYCEECGKVIWMNPVPAAGVLIVRDSEVLLVKRKYEPWKGEWSVPSGFMEIDETPREAAVRELEEETSLSVDAEKITPVENTFFPSYPGKGSVVVMVYRADFKDVSGEPEAGDDAADARFWSLEELERSDEKLREHFRDAIEKTLNSRSN